MLLESPIGSFVARRSAEWQPGPAALLFFRPENVEILDGNGPAGCETNHGAGVVERVTFLGNSADVILRSGATAVRVRAHPARIPAVGKTVSFSVAPSACIVFPV